MKIKLTKASEKDKKPTINLSELSGLNAKSVILELSFDKFGTVTCSFHLSRNGKTYYADKWAGPLPGVGKPIYATLLSYKVVTEIHKQFKLEL